jgi:hypothetical protein
MAASCRCGHGTCIDSRARGLWLKREQSKENQKPVEQANQANPVSQAFCLLYFDLFSHSPL